MSSPMSDLNTADAGSDTELDTRELVRAQNKKKKKSGGFQSMGVFSYPVFKGVMKKGYKVPTLIQRKVVPIILDGKDVVAMARTGSGKTACFLIPMFEKLKAHSAQTGVRGLILSPTRELALQTLKFTKEVSFFFFFALILGGDKMEDQFAALHENPDIIIATPGRLMHVAIEMNLKLRSVEYVVFDRLFEMGFAEQLQEIISRLPETRQTLLFSSTLPKMLLEFARAGNCLHLGLTEPVLIRLDVDTKLSEQLKLSFCHVRAEDKPAVLLHLLHCVVKPQEQTVIFVATKHHAEYLRELLDMQGIPCSHIYSALDQTARKINLGLFLHGKVCALLVTDVAARGIDIPMLDNVINYNFPPKAKLFLHRVGRSGTAYSFIAPDETPYVYDLHLFLGRPLKLATAQKMETEADTDGILGRVPQSLIDDEDSLLITDREQSLELQNLHQIAENAYKQYIKSRPTPSPESIKQVKDANYNLLGVHPLFWFQLGEEEMQRLKFVDGIKSYKSKATIFEINATSKTSASEIMRAKGTHDGKVIAKFQRLQDEKTSATVQTSTSGTSSLSCEPEIDEENMEGVFSQVRGKRKITDKDEAEGSKKRRRGGASQDPSYYIPYRPKDFESERGLSIGAGSFEQAAAGAVMDLLGDQTEDLQKKKQVLKWDRKKKKFVGTGGQEDKNKIKTESGRLISSSYKKNLYEGWKKKYKIDDQDSDEEEERDQRTATGRRKGKGGHGSQRHSSSQSSGPQGKAKSELRSKQQILKMRKTQAKQQFLQKGGLKKSKTKTRQLAHQMKKSAFGRGKSHGFKKGKTRK
ncbi:LOW QUALITY PROTEIN: ATP-dependent RNA helicase DDX54-like [Xenopus laevis]|uniref:RNA helicase n=1 Tax=Xenopus laevis TaxID=8355 RepID=A0A8J0U1R9_XENLA|nr:LOW QUALITY PROTEIN: ATP-dependent RNA helicase DDX54-like [Xenopus laevis]